ncbi:RHS repeat-associated core domain-containing protein [Lachnospiraceae bacterium A4]|nr:RHS repeat-associated core domain-containing protein [Lachnospiraceae bacterium A4]
MNYHDNRYSNLTEERHGDQVLKNHVYDAANRMISGTNLVTGRKSEYTYNGLLARVKKASDAIVSTYIPDYIGGMHNDLVTQVSGLGTVNAAFAHGYSRSSQRFTPEAGVSIPAADTYFQPDLYGSPLFAADADGMIKHRADHDLWGMPKNACEDSAISAGLRFTTYKYDPVLEKHFAHARLYDPARGRMLGTDPVKRGLNGYAYCGNDPVNQTDPTGEIANVLVGGILGAAAGGIIGGAFGFAGSALSQLAEGKGFNARKAWGAAANGAIVGAARGALTGSGVGIPAALGVNFAAGMAGSLAEQKLAGERMSPMRAAVDGAFNALGGRIYGTSPLRNAKDAFIRGALEGAVKGGAYNIADVLDNKLRNVHDSGNRQNPRTLGKQKPWNSRTPRPTKSRCPQLYCIRPKPLKGMRNPKYIGSGGDSNGHTTYRNDRFRLGSFIRDVVAGAVMGGLASVAFYGAGKGVNALRNSIYIRNEHVSSAGIPLEEIPYVSGELNYSEIMHALRASNSIEGDTVAKLLKEKKIQVMVSERFSDGRAGAYFFHTRRIYLYKKVRLLSGKWINQDSESAAGILAHETKHWIDREVKSRKDEYNAYMWQKKVDSRLTYTAEDIWNVLITHPAYKHLKD